MAGSDSMKNGLIVAIDGPSGAGKSTVTRELASRLGYVHIDTGAMFRVIALLLSRRGAAPDDEAALAAIFKGLEIEFDRSNSAVRVLANGEDVSAAIRSPEISLLTSKVAARPAVRSYLLALQREMAKRGGVVLEGRDIGTVVFPDADVKFYLTASAAERGRRRFEELSSKGTPVTIEQTIAEVMQRDEQDILREHAPLRKAEDAVEVDSTALAPAEVIQLMERIVREREAAA
jgi:cytidylate kinase